MSAAKILIAAVLAVAASRTAAAQITVAPLAPSGGGPLTCSDFMQDANGSWSPTRPVTLAGPSGPIQIGPGISLHAGNFFVGSRLAATLDARCR